MNRRVYGMLCILILCCLPYPLLAGNDGADAISGWEYQITPYLWAAGLSGDTAADGVGTPVESDYAFFSLQNLDAAFAVEFTARKGQLALLFDGLYVNFEDQFSNRLFQTDVQVSGGYIEMAGGYRLQPESPIELLGGLRYVSLSSDVALNPGPEVSQSKGWLDPFVGFSWSKELSDSLSGQVRVDLGGFGVSSEMTTNLSAMVGYRLIEKLWLRVGYRYLNLDFKKDRFIFDATAKGWLLGVSIAYR